MYNYPPCPSCGGPQYPYSKTIRNPTCWNCVHEKRMADTKKISNKLKDLSIKERLEWIEAQIIGKMDRDDLAITAEKFK